MGPYGETITDESEPTEITSIHKVSKGPKRGTKMCDWPTVCTLPESGDLACLQPNSMAMLHLKSADGAAALNLRRTLDRNLEVQLADGEWHACESLSELGITTLDLQLSILAPTIFGRRTIENASNSRAILSLMLGYDSLEDIGRLADNLARNRTGLFNKLVQDIDRDEAALRARLDSLVLPKGGSLQKAIKALQSDDKLTSDSIKKAEQELSGEIGDARMDLAKLLGMDSQDEPVSTDLEESLIKALGHLEKGFSSICPLLSAISLENVLPPMEELSSGDQLSELEGRLESFVKKAQTRIAARLDWWRKETASDGKATLLLVAAQSYDPTQMECPVCEQSVRDRPVRTELESLKALAPELREDLKLFFVNLTDELGNIIGENVRSISNIAPRERILEDWKELKTRSEFEQLTSLTESFDNSIIELANTVEVLTPRFPQLVAEDAESRFFYAASQFISKVHATYAALAILRWADSCLELVQGRLCGLLLATAEDNKSSLLSIFTQGKAAAQAIEPLKTLKTQLSDVKTVHAEIVTKETTRDILDTLKPAIEALKKLSKYAVEKTTTVFDEIKDRAIENWRVLYPENCMGLYPSRLVMAGRKDKAIESLLLQGNYEVPAPPFANAGLQRAVALSFLCALLDRHPRGLDFILFDDPILSLDEDHRERWSGGILAPCIETSQIILATHQKQFLVNCRHDFSTGRVVELNPRDRKCEISWMPGDILDQAEDMLRMNWHYVPNILRQYCEQMLVTLQAYCGEDFFTPHNLQKSIQRYADLAEPNPLAGIRQKQIAAALRRSEVTRVLNPGSHAATQENLTKPMVEECFSNCADQSILRSQPRLSASRDSASVSCMAR